MFEGGELRLVILLLMKNEPRHGYDLIREIETRTGGAYAPSPGIVYPALTLLEEIGHVEARASEDAKRLYAITSAGRAHLLENRATAEAALARLDQLRRKAEAFDSGPVFRAMTNLKAVLQQRLANPDDKQLMFSVADLIDEAEGMPEFATQAELDTYIGKLESDMREAAKKFEFEKAAKLRDTIKDLRTREFLFS